MVGCDIHGGVCTNGAGLGRGGGGAVTPDNGVIPVGLLMELANADGALPAGLKDADGCCMNGSTGVAGWDAKVEGAGAGDGAVSNNARKRSMPSSCCGVGLSGNGADEPKELAQMLFGP